MDFLYRRSVPAWIVAIAILVLLGMVVAVAHLVQRRSINAYTPARLDDVAWAIASSPTAFTGILRDEDAVSYPAPEQLPAGLFVPRTIATPDRAHLLITQYDEASSRRIIRILRLADGRFVKRYSLKRQVSRVQPEELIAAKLLPDGGLAYHDNAGFHRVDACGTPLWSVGRRTHHSVEVAENGDFWVPTWIPTFETHGPTSGVDTILRVSPDGKPVYEKRLDTIFAENGLQWIVDGRTFSVDPYHLNDIEPVFTNGTVWKRGDIFLSMRTLSMVMLFRPSTGKVIWWRIGPWSHQHDVQILDADRIALFDNDVIATYKGPEVKSYSRELIVDFRDGSITSPYDAAFKRQAVKAAVQGRGLILDNDDIFVEETTFGRLLRMDKDGNLKWRYIAANAKGERLPLGWTRYLDPARYGAAVASATQARCPI